MYTQKKTKELDNSRLGPSSSREHFLPLGHVQSEEEAGRTGEVYTRASQEDKREDERSVKVSSLEKDKVLIKNLIRVSSSSRSHHQRRRQRAASATGMMMVIFSGRARALK